MNYFKFLVFVLSLATLVPNKAQAEDCDQARIYMSSCLMDVSWRSWGNDYTLVKDVCAETIDLDIRNSCGSVLDPNDQICFYEVDGMGVETQVYCATYANLNFVPTEGKKYRMKVFDPGSSYSSYEITFNAINCMNFSATNAQDPDACLRNNKPINFELPFDLDYDCYWDVTWDFGDGTVVVGTPTEQHTYSFQFSISQPCRNFTVKATATPNYDQECPGCPAYTFTKTVKVCGICEATGHETNEIRDFYMEVSPNPTGGWVNINMVNEGDEVLRHISINNITTGEGIYYEEFPADLGSNYVIETTLEGQPTGYYSVSVYSMEGNVTSKLLFKE